MLEIKFVRQNLPAVQNALAARGAVADIESFKNADARRREVLLEIEKLRHRRNVVSEEIAAMASEIKGALLNKANIFCRKPHFFAFCID